MVKNGCVRDRRKEGRILSLVSIKTYVIIITKITTQKTYGVYYSICNGKKRIERESVETGGGINSSVRD